ncbi:MAG TPA: Holliday junction resolvase RuvX [Thermomicrobiales bacterium]|nr:Holliday junction resolvase RuvX [Thermomicrobiales bacterium]
MSDRGRALGLDVGDVRVGVAISDERGAIASPVETLRRGPDTVAAVGRLAESLGAARVVVGLPTGLSGREGPQAASVRAFAAELAEALGPERPILFWDERLSSAMADRSLAAAGHRRRARRDKIDAVAATVILQGWLDAQRHRRQRRGEIER